MRIQAKFGLAIVTLLVLVVFVISFFSIRSTSQSMLAQMEQDGKAICLLLVQSSSFAERIPGQVEHVLGEQMVVEARITAHMIAIAAGPAGMVAEDINAILQNITETTVLEEFWISDETGQVVYTNTGVDFVFGPDPDEQPQAYVFYQLLGQDRGTVIQQAEKRELDSELFKYVGVSGVDHPRIVQVGYHAGILDELSKDVNMQKLVDELTGEANVAAIWILDDQQNKLSASTQPVDGIGASLSEEDLALAREAQTSGEACSYNQGDVLRVATPLLDSDGAVRGVSLVYLPTENVQSAIRDSIMRTIYLALAVVVAGACISFLLSSGVTRPIRRLTAAVEAMERGDITEDEINRLSGNEGRDEVAALSRVFAKMAAEVKAREAKLKKQVEEMRIEIDHSKKERQVAEITDTDYFQNLKQKAREMRERKKEQG